MATKLFRSILPSESSEDEDPDEDGVSEKEDGRDVASISEKIDE